MSDGMVFCRACGATIHHSAPFCPKCGAPQELATSVAGDGIPRNFGNSIVICFKKYLVFNGRAPRTEFWYFVMFQTIAGIGTSVFAVAAAGGGWSIWSGSPVSTLLTLVLFCPALSVYLRRLHDLDRSGWWYWLCLVPVLGWIVLFVWMCTRGSRGPNRYGPENGLAPTG